MVIGEHHPNRLAADGDATPGVRAVCHRRSDMRELL
jgi:hypothetical protein